MISNNLSKSIVITGASVAGKTTLCRRLMVQFNIEAMPTHMTRQLRTGEIENVDGVYISEKQFRKNFSSGMYIQDNLESCFFGGYYSGCPQSWIESTQRGKYYCFVCPTVKTARELKKILGNKIFWVHLVANSEVRRERLLKRNPDMDKEDFELRIKKGDASIDLTGNDLIIDTSYLNAWEIFFQTLVKI